MSAERERTVAVHTHSRVPAERHCVPLTRSLKAGLYSRPAGCGPGRTPLWRTGRGKLIQRQQTPTRTALGTRHCSVRATQGIMYPSEVTSPLLPPGPPPPCALSTHA